ncbi:CHC2 zinc finger family protein [Anaplasma phagocytophilum str. ApMUC09]|uniref:CHC2 zinc finger family protein n=1 Tax=Anaplasma phagocytophilum str. ApMUC09 TaxID=1359152 RepID=A0A0F3NAG5_ANAPH|nr:CHC2 zinc finger family protein [Anaplasma phagocytophilum str. ApMUC09]
MMLGSIMQNNNSITDNITLLRSKIRLIDVVAGKIKLTKRSGNNYVGLCPFHSEKTLHSILIVKMSYSTVLDVGQQVM